MRHSNPEESCIRLIIVYVSVFVKWTNGRIVTVVMKCCRWWKSFVCLNFILHIFYCTCWCLLYFHFTQVHLLDLCQFLKSEGLTLYVLMLIKLQYPSRCRLHGKWDSMIRFSPIGVNFRIQKPNWPPYPSLWYLYQGLSKIQICCHPLWGKDNGPSHRLQTNLGHQALVK